MKFVKEIAGIVAQAFIEVLLKPENVSRYKLALRQLSGEDMVNAPKRGQADEELEEKIRDSGMADVPLPRHPDDT